MTEQAISFRKGIQANRKEMIYDIIFSGTHADITGNLWYNDTALWKKG